MRTRHGVDNLCYLKASKLSISPRCICVCVHWIKRWWFVTGFRSLCFMHALIPRSLKMFSRFNGKLLHANTHFSVLAAQLFYRCLCAVLCIWNSECEAFVVETILAKKNIANEMPIPYMRINWYFIFHSATYSFICYKMCLLEEKFSLSRVCARVFLV